MNCSHIHGKKCSLKGERVATLEIVKGIFNINVIIKDVKMSYH